MNTLQDLKQWVSKIGKHSSSKNVEFTDKISHSNNQIDALHFYIYTNDNRYSISASIYEDGDTYLRCTASSRKPRAGEDWTRGNDLADGDLNLETWNEILGDIVAYELVRVNIEHRLPKTNKLMPA